MFYTNSGIGPRWEIGFSQCSAQLKLGWPTAHTGVVHSSHWGGPLLHVHLSPPPPPSLNLLLYEELTNPLSQLPITAA